MWSPSMHQLLAYYHDLSNMNFKNQHDTGFMYYTNVL